MKGSGRVFEEKGFLAKIEEIEGYYVAKIDNFPVVPVYKIAADQVLTWYKKGQLGKTTAVSLSKMEQLLKTIA